MGISEGIKESVLEKIQVGVCVQRCSVGSERTEERFQLSFGKNDLTELFHTEQDVWGGS